MKYNITYNKPDMYVTFRDHMRHGDVWTAEVELLMQDTPEEPPYSYWVVVDVIAPNRDLAYYIVSVMYPDYETITIEDVPLNQTNYEPEVDDYVIWTTELGIDEGWVYFKGDSVDNELRIKQWMESCSKIYYNRNCC